MIRMCKKIAFITAGILLAVAAAGTLRVVSRLKVQESSAPEPTVPAPPQQAPSAPFKDRQTIASGVEMPVVAVDKTFGVA